MDGFLKQEKSRDREIRLIKGLLPLAMQKRSLDRKSGTGIILGVKRGHDILEIGLSSGLDRNP